MQGSSIINSFVAGEISPKLAGRTDIQQYFQSAAEIRNMLVECYGGAKKAPGTRYVAEVADSADTTIVRRFVFSDTQAYIIEIGDLYMRFFMDNATTGLGGPITVSSSPYSITTSYPSSIIRELQFKQTADILYVTHPSYPQSKVTRTAHNSWSINIIDYSTDPARPALMDENITTTTITASATTGSSITLTGSQAIFHSDHAGSIWAIGPITGSHGYAQIISVSTGGLKTVAVAKVLYGGALPDTSAHTDWSEGSWSKYRGYPKSVTISEQRLIYGYTAYQPQTIWPSEIGAYDTFELGSDDADAMAIKPDDSDVINWLFPAQEILIGTAGGVITYGTGSDSTALTPTNGRAKKKSSYKASSIIPELIGNSVFYWQKYNRILREYVYSLAEDNYQAKNMTVLSDHITESGIIEMAYQQSPNNILWCVRADGKLAAFTYEADQKVSAWTLHDTNGLYESVAVIPKTSYDEIWFVVKRYINGSWKRYIEYMEAPDFDEQEDMFFIHSGLTLDDPKTITNITMSLPTGRITIISASHGLSNLDEVKIRGVVGMTELNHRKFLVAEAASGTFTIKDLDGNYIDGTDYEDYISGGEGRECFSTLSGLDHLEGETVQVCADGGAHPDCIVVSGAITLIESHSHVSAGLGYKARIKTNDLEAAPGGATSQGKTKRVSSVSVNLYKSLGCSVGTDVRMDAIPFRTSSMPTDQPPELLTGIKTVAFPSGWDKSKSVVIEQEQCLPLHVLSIVTELEVN
jgi:hypothetical protein